MSIEFYIKSMQNHYNFAKNKEQVLGKEEIKTTIASKKTVISPLPIRERTYADLKVCLCSPTTVIVN